MYYIFNTIILFYLLFIITLSCDLTYIYIVYIYYKLYQISTYYVTYFSSIVDRFQTINMMDLLLIIISRIYFKSLVIFNKNNI